jgi:NAD dependent epimerase/dehydratase family enzyme
MLLPFRLGLGGRIGSGEQYLSWITLDDHVGAMCHLLTADAVHGAANLTAPNPVTNAEFTHALGSALHRPTVLPTPLLPLKAVYGAELVDRLLVIGQRAMPRALEASGYEFAHREIDDALRAVLAAPAAA